jgi:hypothetical protein
MDDIFEPTIEISIGTNKIVALCDLDASVSTIPKTPFDRINLGSFMSNELKLNIVDSTYMEAVRIKENIVVNIRGYPTLFDLVIVYKLEENLAPIILGRTILKTVKALIVHSGNHDRRYRPFFRRRCRGNNCYPWCEVIRDFFC